MASLPLVGCSRGRSTPATRLVYGLTLAPSGFDPHLDVSTELSIPLASVYDTLVFRTRAGELVPMLAESWEVCEKGTKYTFHLRSDVRFHDGTNFDAAAMKRTLDRVADPNLASRRARGLLGPYTGCEVVSSRTLVVRLSEPFSPLLESLSQVYLAPASPTALDQWGDEYQFHQVGTGPYRFEEYLPRTRLTLKRWDEYRTIPGTYAHPDPAEFETVEFRFLVEPATRILSLEAGDVDVVGELPPLDARGLEGSGPLRLQTVAAPGMPLLGFFNVGAAPTDDVQVRRALLGLLDLPAIVQAVFGPHSPVAAGPLSHNHPEYTEPARRPWADPADAAALLNEAGWLMGSDSVRRRDGVPLALTALVMDWGQVPDVAHLMQDQWRAAGVQLTLEPVTLPAALAAIAENRHHLVFWSEPSVSGDVLTSFFHSGEPGTRNWGGYRLTKLDEWLDQARRESDSAPRRALYAQVQELIVDEALCIPVRDQVNLVGVRDCVGAIPFDTRGWAPLLHELRGSCP